MLHLLSQCSQLFGHPLAPACRGTISVCCKSQSCWRSLSAIRVVAGTSVNEACLRAVEDHFGRLSTTPTQGVQVPQSGPLVTILSGPSGVGKDAVIKALRHTRPELSFLVTATSRPKRPNEIDGEDYIFVSREQFEEWIGRGELFEYALVYGDYKGIPRHHVNEALSNGSDVVLRVDVQGAASLKKLLPQSVSIFLAAQSEMELVKRLVARKTEPLENMLRRVQTARRECNHIDSFDYVVVNREGDLRHTVAAISAVIEAEKSRTKRRLKCLQPIDI